MSTIVDPRITESSSLAISARFPGIAHTANDEGKAVVYAIDIASGETVGTTRLKGVAFTDPEAMAIRYLPMRGLYRAAIVSAAAGGYNFLAFNPLLHRLVDGTWGPAADLTQWHGDYVNGNVSTLVFVSCLLVAAFLAIAATLRGHAAEPVG